MKLYFTTQVEAQKRADEFHAWLITNDVAYAASVNAGHTKRWTIPAQDTDATGKVTGTGWFIVVKDRCDGAVKTAERSQLKPGDYKQAATVTREKV
jgi:hypothetical protein